MVRIEMPGFIAAGLWDGGGGEEGGRGSQCIGANGGGM